MVVTSPTDEITYEAMTIVFELANIVGQIELMAEEMPEDVALWSAVSIMKDAGAEDPHCDEFLRIAVTAVVDTRRAIANMLGSAVEAAEDITQE